MSRIDLAGTGGGGGGTPGTPQWSIQFNNPLGTFAGSADWLWQPLISAPSAPTVTQVGTPGATSHTYTVVARTSVGATVASAGTTTATSNAVLNGTNFNHIAWSAVANAVSYDVFRDTSTQVAAAVVGLSVDDQGVPANNGQEAVLTNRTQGVFLADNFRVVGHSAFGNTGGIDSQVQGPGDPTDAFPVTYPAAVSITEYISGDLSLYDNFACQPGIESNIGARHTGAAKATIQFHDFEGQLNSDTSGPVHDLTGTLIELSNWSPASVDVMRGLALDSANFSGTSVIGFLYGLHVRAQQFGPTSTGSIGTLVGVNADVQFFNSGTGNYAAAVQANVELSGSALTFGALGLDVAISGGGAGVPKAIGVNIQDTTGQGVISRNLWSVGASSVNLMEGSLDIGKSGGANTGNVNFIGKTSGIVKLSTQDVAGTWTMKLPTTGGTNLFVLQTDGSGNTSWVAQTGGGGSLTIGTTGITGSTANDVLYGDGALLQQAASFNIISGQPNVPAGKAYLHAGNNVLFGVTGGGGGSDNFFEGESGNFTLTGFGNMGTGATSLSSLTTGFNNLGIGAGSGASLTTGSGNAAIGAGALRVATTCSDNTVIGQSAMGNATPGGNQNTVLGVQALRDNTTGAGNFAMGFQSLIKCATGGQNIAIGSQTMGNNIADSSNVAIGRVALANLNGSGGFNICIGEGSGNALTTGGSNISIGGFALSSSLLGGGNVAIGDSALRNGAVGNQNVVVGSGSGQNVGAANRNTFLGANVGNSITTGQYNLILGDFMNTGANVSGVILLGSGGTNQLDYNLTVAGQWTMQSPLVLTEAANLIHTNVALTNNAGANIATMTNAPVSGNPTKWIQIDDNGTARRIPAW